MKLVRCERDFDCCENIGAVTVSFKANEGSPLWETIFSMPLVVKITTENWQITEPFFLPPRSYPIPICDLGVITVFPDPANEVEICLSKAMVDPDNHDPYPYHIWVNDRGVSFDQPLLRVIEWKELLEEKDDCL